MTLVDSNVLIDIFTNDPDFYIGAHAEVNHLQVLTRDPRRYRHYFPKVHLICPK